MARGVKKIDEIREAAENDLISFIQLVAPHRVLGGCHKEVCQWWQREGAKRHQLLLMPRDHGKSALVAYRVAQRIARDPTVRIVYLSSTSLLAEKQLKFIKDILESERFRFYWPQHVNENEMDRERWTNTEVSVDHPSRKQEGVRDPTIIIGGLTTSLTGLHGDVIVLDDIVVMENAYTGEGREKVKRQYSLLASIAGAEGEQWVVGTRYHPLDLYGEMLSLEQDIYDDEGVVVARESIYEVWERPVEDRGDGTGQFLWPRQQRPDGKWFGFDMRILAEKRGLYMDQNQFRAQYYNDPNIGGEGGIAAQYFQYYEPKHLHRADGHWWFKERRLNIYAAMDFAYSRSKQADYTVIVVIGIDWERNVYVLEIKRFKTTSIAEYYKNLFELYAKWQFRKVRAETSSAQEAIVEELKNHYIRPNGLPLSVEAFKPNRHEGTKNERIDSTLRPRYEAMAIWHYQGGNTQVLEEELSVAHPAHDDVKDALANAIAIAIPPGQHASFRPKQKAVSGQPFHPRFGGIAH